MTDDTKPTEQDFNNARNFMNTATWIVLNENTSVEYKIASGNTTNGILNWPKLVQETFKRLSWPLPPEPEAEFANLAYKARFYQGIFAEIEGKANRDLERVFAIKKYGRNWYTYDGIKEAKPKQVPEEHPITHTTNVAGDLTYISQRRNILSTSELIKWLDYAVQHDLLNVAQQGLLQGIRKRSFENFVSKMQTGTINDREDNDAQDDRS